MANEEQLRILKEQGVEAWNTWRRQTPDARVNLRGAAYAVDLSSADLTKLGGPQLSEVANLRRANLGGANLGGANLRRANLGGANLFNADLRGADLRGADLNGSDLSFANLNKADLTGADLSGADLIVTELEQADFRQARFFDTNLSSVNLSGCQNLDAIRHRGPSSIDVRTLQRSGPLPLVFLRGVGLPDALIEYLPSLLNQAIQHYSCFISYSSKDDEFARRLQADLQNSSVRCRFAPHDMKIGAKILDTLDEAIRLRDKVLLVLSAASIASDWVEDEITKAFAEERQRGGVVLFPVRLDDVVLETKEAWAAKLRANRNIGDFRDWKDHDAYQRTLGRLLRDLRVEIT
jgi:hypothetical protein